MIKKLRRWLWFQKYKHGQLIDGIDFYSEYTTDRCPWEPIPTPNLEVTTSNGKIAMIRTTRRIQP